VRNPFKRKRIAPGAKSEWDESEHIQVGDEQVAIPIDQLPPDVAEQYPTPEAAARLSGFLELSDRSRPSRAGQKRRDMIAAQLSVVP
jgi:hypothetical protein